MEYFDDLSEPGASKVEISHNGAIGWTRGMRWVTCCPVYMHYFPFDTQVTSGNIESRTIYIKGIFVIWNVWLKFHWSARGPIDNTTGSCNGLVPSSIETIMTQMSDT